MTESPFNPHVHVVLVGHGAPAKDAPRELVTRFKALEGRRAATGGPVTEEEHEVDRQLRAWPRTAATDPYQAGLESLAAVLAPKLAPARLWVAYNEFCAPSVEDAIESAVASGARDLRVITTMMTPGGVHAAREIPETLEAMRRRHPGIVIQYAWPPELELVAELLTMVVSRTKA